MKVLKSLLVAIFVLAVLIFIGAYIFLKCFDINKYRDQIAAQISKQAGRNVSIKNIGLDLSLFNGVFASMQGLTVSEDPVFGQGNFALVGEVKLNVDVLAYLTRREIVISKIVIDALQVDIIRDAAGTVNVSKIGSPPVTMPASSGNPASLPPAASLVSAPVVPNFSVKTITISNAAVLFADKGLNPPMQIAVSQIDLIVKNFSLNGPFSFEGKLALLGTERNLTFLGQAIIDLSAQDVKLDQVQMEFDLAKFKREDLLKAVPQLSAAGLKDDFAGKVVIHLSSLNVGVKGLKTLAMNGKLQGGKVSTALLPAQMERITVDFTADENNIDVVSFSLQLLTGMVTGKVKITDYLASQGLNLQAKAIAVPLDGIVTGLPQGMKLGGGLNADVMINGQNLADPDKFLNSLNGSGQIDVKNGRIENFNLLKTIFSRIEFIPGLAALVDASMPERYRGDYTRDETIFEKISTSLQITNGTANLPDVKILADLFEADMQITADFKLNGKVAGQVKIPTDLSEYLLSQADSLAYLKDKDGKIVFPLTSFQGSLTSLKIIPDVKSLGKAAVMGEGRNQLNKLLNKVLKTDDAPDSSSVQGNSSAPAPEKEIINNVLDKIFK